MKTIRWEITSKCNLKCKHCIVGNIFDDDIELSEAKKVVDVLKEKGYAEISFTTKEPFMFNGFMELLEYCTIQGISFSIITNGTLLNKKRINELSKLKLKYICISLDGWTKEDNDSIRGDGTFDKVLSALYLLKDHNHKKKSYIPVYIQTLLTSLNIKNMNKMADFFNQFPDFVLTLGTIMEYGNANKNSYLILKNRIENKERLVKEINKMNCSVYLKDDSFYEEAYSNFIYGFNYKLTIPSCSITNDHFSILSDGTLCKCILLLDQNAKVNFKLEYPKIGCSNVIDMTDYSNSQLMYKNNNTCKNCIVSDKCRLCYLISENKVLLEKQISECSYFMDEINKIIKLILLNEISIEISNNVIFSNDKVYVLHNDFSIDTYNINKEEFILLNSITKKEFSNIYEHNIMKRYISLMIYRSVIKKSN